MESSNRKDQIKKAQQKYRKVATRAYLMRFNKETDADVIEMLDKTKNRQNYIRRLIKDDIATSGGDIGQITGKRKITVSVSYDAENRQWKASCPAASLKLKSDSLDILICRIKEAMTTPYIISIDDIEIS